MNIFTCFIAASENSTCRFDVVDKEVWHDSGPMSGYTCKCNTKHTRKKFVAANWRHLLNATENRLKQIKREETHDRNLRDILQSGHREFDVTHMDIDWQQSLRPHHCGYQIVTKQQGKCKRQFLYLGDGRDLPIDVICMYDFDQDDFPFDDKNIQKVFGVREKQKLKLLRFKKKLEKKFSR